MITYTLDQLREKSENMFKYLVQPIPQMTDEDKVIERVMHLGRMIAESGEYKSVSQYKVDEMTHGEIGKLLDRELSPSIMKEYAKAGCKDWNYLVNSFDRINSAAGKQLMALQTLIAFERAKMNII